MWVQTRRGTKTGTSPSKKSSPRKQRKPQPRRLTRSGFTGKPNRLTDSLRTSKRRLQTTQEARISATLLKQVRDWGSKSCMEETPRQLYPHPLSVGNAHSQAHSPTQEQKPPL